MPQARTAARTADPSEMDQQLHEAEERREKAEGLVMEMAADRESLNSRMNTLDGAMQTLLGEVRLTNEALGGIREKQDELTSRVTIIESGTEPVSKRVSRETRKVANDSRNFARRAWDRTKRELKPGPVEHDHVKGLVIGNLVEYGALVGIAQIAPVATMNGIATALFI